MSDETPPAKGWMAPVLAALIRYNPAVTGKLIDLEIARADIMRAEAL
jgi:hypothetical protein